MKLLKSIGYILSIASVMSMVEAARAETYTYDRHIGKVFIRDVNVDFASNGVTLSVNIHTPTCPNRNHVEGYVEVIYSHNGGVAPRRWYFSGSDEENVDRKYSDFIPFNNPQAVGLM